MKTYVLTILFGVALVQALPTLKSLKPKSELKDWSHEKKLSTKFDDESTDIKQGNRTKKSVVCLDIALPENGDCAPGCSEQHRLPSLSQTPVMYQPQSPSQVMIPAMAPQSSGFFNQQSQVSHQVMVPSVSQPSGIDQSQLSYQVMIPPSPQPSGMDQSQQSYQVMIPPSPQPSGMDQSQQSYQVMIPPSPQPSGMDQSQLSYQVMIPAASQSSGFHQSQISHQVMIPGAPQSSGPYQYQPPTQVMIPAPAPPSRPYQYQPPTRVMMPAPAPPSGPYQYQPPTQVITPAAPQPPSVQQFGPPPPVMLPLPQAPLIIPPALRPPQIVGPIPQLPPCPPEQQFVIPGKDSEEIISYEMVPVSHHVPSSPAQVITTQRPPYPCIPAGQSQSSSQSSAASLTTIQQQSAVNNVQVVQGNSYPTSFGNSQYTPSSGNVHMMQMPSSNPSHNYQSPHPSGNAHLPQQPISYSPHNQYAGQSPVYQQPTMMMGPSDCAPSTPIQNGGFGYAPAQSGAHSYAAAQSAAQSYAAAQNVAQSYAAAQSTAYSGFGLPYFRSADDSSGESGVVLVAAVNSTLPHSQGFSVPSARYSSQNVIQRLPRSGLSENGQVKRESSKKGTEEKIKA